MINSGLERAGKVVVNFSGRVLCNIALYGIYIYMYIHVCNIYIYIILYLPLDKYDRLAMI